MKRLSLILTVLVLVVSVAALADVFVDDIYYYPGVEKYQKGTNASSDKDLKPYYNSNIKEIIFIDEDTTNLHPDTVKAVILR